MNDALARVFALQQRELNEKERQRQQQIAKRQRLIAAFNASGIINIFETFRNVPLRDNVRGLTYKKNIGELTYSADRPASSLSDMSFAAVNGQTSGPRWWCEETDTGRMKYGYSSGRAGDRGEFFDTPQGLWLDAFVEYIAAAADPITVAEKLSETQANVQPARRQLQPI